MANTLKLSHWRARRRGETVEVTLNSGSPYEVRKTDASIKLLPTQFASVDAVGANSGCGRRAKSPAPIKCPAPGNSYPVSSIGPERLWSYWPECPTPAVGGAPALPTGWLEANEDLDRGWYGIGRLDNHGR